MAGVKLRGWRRIAAATWRAPDNPQYYGAVDVDAAPLLAFLDRARVAGREVTVTHLLGRAVEYSFGLHPEANFRLIWGRAVPRRSVDVLIVAAIEGGRTLSGVRIDHVDRRSVFDVGEEIERRVEELRAGEERILKRGTTVADWLPWPALRLALRFLPWLAGEAGVDLRALGMPPSPFGCAMITNVGARSGGGARRAAGGGHLRPPLLRRLCRRTAAARLLRLPCRPRRPRACAGRPGGGRPGVARTGRRSTRAPADLARRRRSAARWRTPLHAADASRGCRGDGAGMPVR